MACRLTDRSVAIREASAVLGTAMLLSADEMSHASGPSPVEKVLRRVGLTLVFGSVFLPYCVVIFGYHIW